jgi:multicomponent K+:H+ antiporter subunit E
VSVLGKLLPAPLLSVCLLLLWLALARSTSAGQVILGVALALAIPLLTATLRPTRARVRRPLVVARFVLRVSYDLVVSAFQVARDVVVWRRTRPRFVVVPLDMRDPLGLAALAMVTTIVPGTVWSEIALDRSAMMLHVWDVDEEAAFAARFKARYEAPLREIFE